MTNSFQININQPKDLKLTKNNIYEATTKHPANKLKGSEEKSGGQKERSQTNIGIWKWLITTHPSLKPSHHSTTDNVLFVAAFSTRNLASFLATSG